MLIAEPRTRSRHPIPHCSNCRAELTRLQDDEPAVTARTCEACGSSWKIVTSGRARRRIRAYIKEGL